MICKEHFRKKKNGEPVKNRCFCRYPELIENYDKAIADKTQTWECHHRKEEFYSRKELKERGEYFDVPPEELIFLTKAEHTSLHMSDRKVSNETRKKLSELHKGNNYNLGRKYSAETKQKISESNKISHSHECKRVSCLETHEVYDSLSDASRKTGIGKSNISAVCLGKHKTAGGYHWRFC